MQGKICTVNGEDTVTDQMCQKQFAKFHAGKFSLDDAPWLGRHVEGYGDQIKILRTLNVKPRGDS